MLSSKLFFQTILSVKISFACTKFVIYECLHKPRNSSNALELDLQRRFESEQAKGRFREYHIDIEDLQDIDVLSKRKNLSKGELSSMVFAKRTSQAFMTDDQGARKLASSFMYYDMVQTTPQLIGWLIFEEYLNDAEIESIIAEHDRFNRPLGKYFREVYKKAMEYRLLKSV